MGRPKNVVVEIPTTITGMEGAPELALRDLADRLVQHGSEQLALAPGTEPGGEMAIVWTGLPANVAAALERQLRANMPPFPDAAMRVVRRSHADGSESVRMALRIVLPEVVN